MNNYDVIIIGAGPGGIFGAYELIEKNPELQNMRFLRQDMSLLRENVLSTERK